MVWVLFIICIILLMCLYAVCYISYNILETYITDKTEFIKLVEYWVDRIIDPKNPYK